MWMPLWLLAVLMFFLGFSVGAAAMLALLAVFDTRVLPDFDDDRELACAWPHADLPAASVASQAGMPNVEKRPACAAADAAGLSACDAQAGRPREYAPGDAFSELHEHYVQPRLK